MATWIKRPDANGLICDCRQAVCDLCECRYFGSSTSGYYAQIVGYSDSLFPICVTQSRTEPAWSGRFAQVFAEFAPCDWRDFDGSVSYHGQTAVLIGAVLYYNPGPGARGFHGQPARTWRDRKSVV